MNLEINRHSITVSLVERDFVGVNVVEGDVDWSSRAHSVKLGQIVGVKLPTIEPKSYQKGF